MRVLLLLARHGSLYAGERGGYTEEEAERLVAAGIGCYDDGKPPPRRGKANTVELSPEPAAEAQPAVGTDAEAAEAQPAEAAEKADAKSDKKKR